MSAAENVIPLDASRPPPHTNTDLELALIGRILFARTPGAYHEARANCTPEDFCSSTCGHVFELFEIIDAEGEAISYITTLARSGPTIEATLGADISAKAFLEGAIAISGTRPYADAPIATLAKQVSNLALKRRLDAELEAGRLRLLEGNSPIAAAISGVAEAVSEVHDRAARARGHKSIGTVSDEILKRVEDALNGKRAPAIRSGIAALDRVTGGFHPGDLAILAGRPGMGKSVALGGISLRAALAGNPVLLFSLEMPTAQVLERMACDLDYDALAPDARPLVYEKFRDASRENISDAEFTRLYSALKRLSALPLEIHDAGGLTMMQISAVAERFAARHGGKLGLVGIDHLQLVRSDSRSENRVNELTRITGDAKILAKRLGWPVCALSQLSRKTEERSESERRPRLSDLRESGSIEQDADAVITLYREAYYLEQSRPARGPSDPGYAAWRSEYLQLAHKIEFGVPKNRHGRTGIVLAECHIGSAAIRDRPGDNVPIAHEYEEATQ